MAKKFETGRIMKKMSDELTELLALVAQLPKGLRSDWDGTNHYEMTQSGNKEESYWWLDLSDYLNWDSITKVLGQDFSDTEDGKKIGLLMDIAVKVKAVEEILRAVKE